MRMSGKCPKCPSQDFFVVEEVQSPNYEYSNSIKPVTLTSHYGSYGEKGLLGGPKQTRAGVHMEAWVCAGCGYTELYAKDMERLADFAERGVAGVRKQSGASGTPFR